MKEFILAILGVIIIVALVIWAFGKIMAVIKWLLGLIWKVITLPFTLLKAIFR